MKRVHTGNKVTCLDIDREKIEALNEGHLPIYEPRLDEIIRRNRKSGRLRFTTDAAEAYQRAEAIFICVGTPSDDRGRADLSAAMQVATEIGDAIEAAPGPTGGTLDDHQREKIVVLKSTVPVGTNARIREAIAARTSKPFRMASNPEFLKEGAAVSDFNKPDRVIIGAEDKTTGDRLRDLYEPFVHQGNPIFVMDIPSAEMVTYAATTMLATKISYINEMAPLCEAYGADIDEIRRGMGADHRIGNQFFYPGLGYGGSCFPKDVLACIGMGDGAGEPVELLSAVHQINQRQRTRFLEKIDQHFGGDLAGRRIAVWGLAFKPGTDDMREAPSITIIGHLLEHGAEVVAYDPAAVGTAQRIFGNRIEYHNQDELAALDGAEALVMCTDWDEFKHPEFDEMLQRMAEPVIFDGRNLYRPRGMAEAGFTYYSVGRPLHQPGDVPAAETETLEP
jgi:UDPglucose 6-dehydrogenase